MADKQNCLSVPFFWFWLLLWLIDRWLLNPLANIQMLILFGCATVGASKDLRGVTPLQHPAKCVLAFGMP